MRRLSKATGIAAALLAMAAPSAVAAEVTIYRGATKEVVATEKLAGVPTVLRGGGSMVPRVLPEPPEARGIYPRFAAGQRLWLLGKDGRLTACTLRGTGYSGRRRIVCTRH